MFKINKELCRLGERVCFKLYGNVSLNNVMNKIYLLNTLEDVSLIKPIEKMPCVAGIHKMLYDILTMLHIPRL